MQNTHTSTPIGDGLSAFSAQLSAVSRTKPASPRLSSPSPESRTPSPGSSPAHRQPPTAGRRLPSFPGPESRTPNPDSSIAHRQPPTASRSVQAFSLVELLVVIGIISLLIGIAMPAFSSAKRSANNAKTKAAIGTIETGLNSFRADEKFGGSYPPSYYFANDGEGVVINRNPYNFKVSDPNFKIGGAGLVVWALAGADLLGTPGFRDMNHRDYTGGIAPWADDISAILPDSSKQYPDSLGGLYALNGSSPVQPRNAFVDVTKIKTSEPKMDGTVKYFQIPSAVQPAGMNIDEFRKRQSAPVFLDAFDQPILYYKANPGRINMTCDLTPNKFFNSSYQGATGVYNLADNLPTTGCMPEGIAGLDFGAGEMHFVHTPNNAGNPTACPTGTRIPGTEPTRGSFAWTFFNPSSTAWTPHNAETFVLLSAGPDGKFGTPDDIGNFETNR